MDEFLQTHTYVFRNYRATHTDPDAVTKPRTFTYALKYHNTKIFRCASEALGLLRLLHRNDVVVARSCRHITGRIGAVALPNPAKASPGRQPEA